MRSDSSTPHFINQAFKDARRERGIDHEASPPYGQHKNGAAEKMIQTICLKARCNMIDAGLPPKFWAEATNTAVTIHRITPQQGLGWRSPHEMLYGKVPEISHLRRFGALCYIHIPEEKRVDKKLGPRSEPGVMIGYVNRTAKLWRIWNFRLYAAENYSDVTFVEDKNGWTSSRHEIEEYDDALPNLDFEEESVNLTMHLNVSTPPRAPELPGVSEVKRIIKKSQNLLACKQAELTDAPLKELEAKMRCLHISSTTEDPKSYEEAMKSKDAEKWKQAVRKQRGHTFSLDHVLVASEEAAHPMRTYRRQYDVCVGRVSEARRAPLDW